MRKIIILITLFAASAAFAQQRDSLDIKIGQMLLIGYPGPELDSTLLQEVKEGKVGSVILFEKNVPKTPTAFYTLKKYCGHTRKLRPYRCSSRSTRRVEG